ncbi:unnamed protein product [Trifolium pratense]|uniref:Uncharacterized protein n=1 Tax=Trifolium pratense TaxID=57577 RepID=A0ACB0M1X3_TRIPR|nr:unnamed protein product [Trifolium pratense]
MLLSLIHIFVISTVEAIKRLETGILEKLSVQELLDHVEMSDTEGAYKYIMERGVSLQKDYPLSQGTNAVKTFIAGYKYIHTVAGIAEKMLKSAVYRQPVVVVIIVGDEFENYKAGDGIFQTESDLHSGGGLHSVLVIGFGKLHGKKYWIIRNSYGTEWGYEGYGLILRDFGPFYGMCNIAEEPSYPLWEVEEDNDGLTSVDSDTVSEAAAVSGRVFSSSVVVPDKIGEQQQHQNFPDEPTTESTSSTWIGKNLIVEDDMKSPHDVDSSAGVSASLPEAAYGCVSASALSKP